MCTIFEMPKSLQRPDSLPRKSFYGVVSPWDHCTTRKSSFSICPCSLMPTTAKDPLGALFGECFEYPSTGDQLGVTDEATNIESFVEVVGWGMPTAFEVSIDSDCSDDFDSFDSPDSSDSEDESVNFEDVEEIEDCPLDKTKPFELEVPGNTICRCASKAFNFEDEGLLSLLAHFLKDPYSNGSVIDSPNRS
ncbi:MAG: hypothetical protein BYD32DRAFT_456278 [Podila humilis]|nr:MAG: hypothetical protein BYD32DRAFT_456278 [Podila humilis]